MYKLIAEIESLGGLFTITSINNIELWKGVNNKNLTNDYDIICEKFDFKERIYKFKEKFNIFRCDSKVLLIYKDLKGNIALLEQEYIDNLSILNQEIDIKISTSLELEINIENHSLIIFDSTLDSSEIVINSPNGKFNSNSRFLDFYDIFVHNSESIMYKSYLSSFLIPNKICLRGVLLIAC